MNYKLMMSEVEETRQEVLTVIEKFGSEALGYNAKNVELVKDKKRYHENVRTMLDIINRGTKL